MDAKQMGYSDLMRPMEAHGGLVRPVFSRNAACMSLELASLAYTLDVESWRREGWTDISYHVDNTLLTGDEANGGTGGKWPGLMSEYRQFLTRLKVKSTNILGQVLGTVRQREHSDTCKAVVMIKKQPDGRYLVAIGFMGTGKRLHDWISNFRFIEEDGLHQGCLQLTRHFEDSLDKIVFQETAAELGLERLTLSDILQACKKADSPFRLWLAGHSQGGGVMQAFAYRMIRQGVLREHIIGYGFASPSVLYGGNREDVRSIPLFHLLNGDDLVCRLGARLHVGTCFSCVPDERMRQICYGNVWQQKPFRSMLNLMHRVRSNGDAILFLLALIRSYCALEDAEMMRVLSAMLARILPEKMNNMLGGKVDEGLQLLRRYLEGTYISYTGLQQLPEWKVTVLSGQVDQLMKETGAKGFLRYLVQAISVPHRMRYLPAYGKALPAYQYMAEYAGDVLINTVTLHYPLSGKRSGGGERRKAWGRFGRRI